MDSSKIIVFRENNFNIRIRWLGRTVAYVFVIHTPGGRQIYLYYYRLQYYGVTIVYPERLADWPLFFSNAKSDVCFAFVLVIVSSPAGYHSHRLTNAMPCLNKVTLCSFSWHNILHHRDEQARYRTIQSRCEKKQPQLFPITLYLYAYLFCVQ